MIYYACISCAYSDGMRHAGTCYAETMRDLKRKASRIANNHFSTMDKMEVSRYENGHEINAVFYRINRKAPNNTIKRGEWK